MRWFTRRRVFVLALLLVFFAFVVREVFDPFGDAEYLEIPHGDHSHFVPRDRDPNVPLHSFPRTPPGPNERILPNGQIAPIDTTSRRGTSP
ncbi:MAG: hypothetical protein AAGI71_15795 [Bacteroidota bacterium]